MKKKTTRKKFRFEEGLKQLEEIVDLLESGDLDLEEAIDRYEEGITIYRQCAKKLEDSKRRIEEIVNKEIKEVNTEDQEIQ